MVGTGDRGRGQGVLIRGHNGRVATAFAAVAPSPHKHWGTKTNKHAFPPFLLLWEKKTNVAAILLLENKRLIKHSIA